MIVADSNLIAYLLIPGEHTAQARAVLEKDPNWVAPLLWRSEVRNVLALYLRQASLSLGEALQFMREAEDLLQGGEYHVESSQVLGLAADSRCSAYDCEFVALARQLALPLVTTDKQILATFSPPAIRPADFCAL